ncbi:MAG: hypothetical protein HQ445_09090 [Polaromonas sp.]|nr:hypothetical protein [Polaromonas sp.]
MANPNEAAIQLVYLVEGIEPVLAAHQVATRLNPATPGHLMTADGGHLGMVSDLADYAVDVADYINKMVGVQDFPGVFEYEVTSELGTWMAKLPGDQWPSRDAFKAELEKLGAEFFAQ